MDEQDKSKFPVSRRNSDVNRLPCEPAKPGFLRSFGNPQNREDLSSLLSLQQQLGHLLPLSFSSQEGFDHISLKDDQGKQAKLQAAMAQEGKNFEDKVRQGKDTFQARNGEISGKKEEFQLSAETSPSFHTEKERIKVQAESIQDVFQQTKQLITSVEEKFHRGLKK